MPINHVFHRCNHALQPHVGKLLLLGLAGVFAQNWRIWQRDKVLAEKLRNERLHVPHLQHSPKVSILVAAWNEHDYIDDHIRSFLDLTYPDIGLILCAGGTDDTLERARLYAGEQVHVLEQKAGEGKQRALEQCYAHATGEIIYLTDADCIFDMAALIHVLAPLINEGEDVSTGTYRPLNNQMCKIIPAYLWASMAMSSAPQSPYIGGLTGANAAITHTALERSGGFAFTARTGTDYQLGKRLIANGYNIRFLPASDVPTAYPETLLTYRRVQSRWLRNLLLHGPRYGAHSEVRATLKTMSTGIFMLFAPLLALFFGWSALVTWALLVAHAMVSKVRYSYFTARLYRRQISAHVLISIVPMTFIDFVIWALPALDMLWERGRKQW